MLRNQLVLVGNAQEGTLAAFQLDDDAFRPPAVTHVGAGCSTFAVDVERGLVYTTVRDPDPMLVALMLDHDSGRMTELSRREIDDPLAYLALARGGTLLLGASYHGGWGGAWPVADGELGKRTSVISYRNMHAVVPTDDGDHAYFVSLGDALIAPVTLNDRGFEPFAPIACPEGSGPRHLIFSDDDTTAYLLTEYTGKAVRFERDKETGALISKESVVAYDTTRGLKESRFGADPLEEGLVWGADLHLAGEGRWLLCSERTNSTIASIALGGDRGVLGDVVALTETEQQPRGFGVSRDGSRVVVVGERSGQATLYRVLTDGSLKPLDRTATGAGPNWVRFV